MEINMINIALLGFGVVGSGCAEVLTSVKDKISAQVGDEISIKYILDLRDFPDSPFGKLIVHDFNTILNDPEVSVVAEMMGGSHPAYDFTKALLAAGKSVVTSNKEVVSTFGVELLTIAAENNVRYLFEASVGGGIPIIRPLTNDLAANEIVSIDGILNGTTNFILTKMRNEGLAFEDVLKEAQRLGYAEANPSADVDGIDAARKIAILGAMASGKLADPKKIPTEGIREVSATDTEIAKELGYAIKLIGHYESSDDGRLSLSVAPRFVPLITSPLAGVDDVYNGIMVRGSMLGDSMFYGKGAGKLPTASAVCADIIDAAKNPTAGDVPLRWEDAESILSADEIKTKLCIITETDSDAEKAATALGCLKEFYRTASVMAGVSDIPLSSDDIRSVTEANGFIKTYAVM